MPGSNVSYVLAVPYSSEYVHVQIIMYYCSSRLVLSMSQAVFPSSFPICILDLKTKIQMGKELDKISNCIPAVREC